MNLCDDNRTATIEAAKTALIKGTNIEDSPEEMKVLNSFLLRCWQMGWLDRYAPPRHFNAMPKEISERMAAGHGSNVPMQPNIPPMPYNTSNALKALNSANATQSNALDSISRAIKEQMHRSVEEWEKLQPVFTEIAEEYKKACEISYINKPLAYALHEVWKKYDRRDTKRNE